MLKALILILIVAVNLGVAKEFCCSANQSVKHHFNSKKVSDRTWSLLASINLSNNRTNRPFSFPADASIQIEARNRFFVTNKKLWDRLTIIFKCSHNKSIGTFLEITKHYAMIKIKDDPIYRYCVGTKVYRWTKISTYFNENNDLLMFYVCDRSVEYFILLTSFGDSDQKTKSYVEKETTMFLTKFSTDLHVENLTYVDTNAKPSGDCKHFMNDCLRDLENSVDTTLAGEPMEKKEISVFISRHIFLVLFVMTLTVFLLIISTKSFFGRMKRSCTNGNAIRLK